VSNLAKLKKQAAEFEQKRQFDKALAKYQQVLDEMVGDFSEADVALYNRVGDLLLRQGNISEAVIHYERAVDLYADGGYFSNAIALCNKILRTAPGRSSIYYKLGRISARKGFISDAKQNFLEYADRMRKAGQIDEAFRALKEFADLCPDQDDIRIMLADQLARDGRGEEAIQQLQLLHEKANAEGRTTEAKAVLERMRAIDPTVVPSISATPSSTPAAREGLSFLMPDDARESDRPRTPSVTPRPVPRYTPHGSSAVVDLAGLPLIHPDLDDLDLTPVEGIERTATLDDVTPISATPVEGLDHAFFEAPDSLEVAPLADLELAVPDEDVVSLGSDADQDTPPPELEIITGESAAIDIPLLLPDESLVASNHAATPQGSLVLPEVVPQEPEELELEAQDAPFAIDSIGDGSPFEPVDADLGAGEIGDVEPDGWSAPEELEDIGAVAVDELPGMEPGPSLESRLADLRDRLEAEPGNAELHRELGEVLIESGARGEGLEQLEAAIWEFERIGAFGRAYTIANEILHVEPDAVRFHQKRVEFAFRTGEKGRLVDAYLGLADSLVRGGEISKARVVYQRVIDLSPDDARARVALDTVTDPSRPPTPPEPAPASPPPAAETRVETPRVSAAVPPANAVRPTSRRTPPGTDFVDLASWMDEGDRPRSTRMIAEGVTEPADDAQADFAEMLERFKEGVAANLDDGDHQSHYDLGIAYREMGLIDEAIAEFQKALRSTDDRVKTYEALGQCFLEKQHYPVAITMLSRALTDGRHGDDTLIGVLYMLGTACEAVGRHAEARTYYERVYAVDIRFRDVNDRLTAVEQTAR
jgi:tetratricopeptide (TPR) repeat protein